MESSKRGLKLYVVLSLKAANRGSSTYNTLDVKVWENPSRYMAILDLVPSSFRSFSLSLLLGYVHSSLVWVRILHPEPLSCSIYYFWCSTVKQYVYMLKFLLYIFTTLFIFKKKPEFHLLGKWISCWLHIEILIWK